jgi:hypothetical protein
MNCCGRAFALLTLRAGKEPGLGEHSDEVPYPWRAVVFVCLLLSAEVAVLHWIVRSGAEQSWRRLGRAAALFAALGLFSLLTFATDMPGYYYVPQNFHILTFLVLVTVIILRPVRFRRRGSSS